MVNELETCAAFVPQELSKGNLNDAKTLELGAIIKKAHVLDSEKPTAQEYMDVSSNSLTENTLFYLDFFCFLDFCWFCRYAIIIIFYFPLIVNFSYVFNIVRHRFIGIVSILIRKI